MILDINYSDAIYGETDIDERIDEALIQKAAVQLPAIQLQRAPFGDLHHAHGVVAILRLAPDGAVLDRQRGGRTLERPKNFRFT